MGAVEPELVEAAADIGRGAAAITLEWFRNPDLQVAHKADGSEVTAADRAAEAYARDQIRLRFPDDGILGEEQGAVEGTSGRRWIIDPIDGTTSFVRGVPLYSTLLAVVDDEGPAVGVVIIPALGEEVVAGRGRGCTHDGRPARVSSVDVVGDALVSASAFDGSWWPREALLAVTSSGAKTRTWGDGYGYVLLATGRIDAMIEPALNVWDIAPMLTIVPEAGGRVTTWTGETSLTQGSAWLASNGRLHSSLLDLVSSDA